MTKRGWFAIGYAVAFLLIGSGLSRFLDDHHFFSLIMSSKKSMSVVLPSLILVLAMHWFAHQQKAIAFTYATEAMHELKPGVLRIITMGLRRAGLRK